MGSEVLVLAIEVPVDLFDGDLHELRVVVVEALEEYR